jgi:hypothetical protein
VRFEQTDDKRVQRIILSKKEKKKNNIILALKLCDE